MKIIMFIAMLLAVVSSSAFAGLFPDFDDFKKIDNPNRPIEFILDVPGNTQSQLFSTVKSWLGEVRILTNMDADKDSGRIVGSGGVVTQLEEDDFSLRVDTKNGKVKMSFTNFNFRQLQRSGGTSHGVYDKNDLNKATNIAKIWSDKFLQYANQQSASSKW